MTGSSKRHWVFRRIVPLAVLALVLFAAFRLFSIYQGAAEQRERKIIRMTTVQARQENGQIAIALSVLEKYRLVYFEYRGTRRVPLMAYIGPSGRIITAISLSEPCQSATRFHIEGDNLVCDVCGTVWNLETHQGVSGGCTKFPPQIIPNEVKGGQVLISEEVVLKWKRRSG